MEKFLISGYMYITIQGHSYADAIAQFHDWLHDAPFVIEYDKINCDELIPVTEVEETQI